MSWKRVRRAAFGDRVGEALFVGALVVYAALWHVGFVLNDNWTIANALVGVADGHLYIDRVVYGTYVSTPGTAPGTKLVGQRLYGRQYGLVFFALPFLWALELVTAVVDPRILIAAGWSLLLVLFAQQLGRLTGRYRPAVLGGCGVALLAFVVNGWLATPLDRFWLPVVALQVSTMVAGAVLAVGLYRLVGTVTDRRTGGVVAALAAVGSPVGFWASIPKRHTLAAALVVLVVYSFLRSRDAEGTGAARRHRALAYAWVGLLTWVNAAEGLLALAALGLADLPTARENGWRTLGTVAGALLVALLPFFLTNAAVTGNPLLPSNLWPNFDGTRPFMLEGQLRAPNGTLIETPTAGTGGSAGGSGGGGGGGSGSSGHPGLLTVALGTLSGGVDRLVARVNRSFGLLFSDPDRLYRTFVRSGWHAAQAVDTQSVNLTILESVPLVGAVLGAPFLVRRVTPNLPRAWDAPRQADLLVGSLAVGYLLFYLPSLPIHAQFTVRYLHPLIPLLLYATARLPAVRRVLAERFRLVAWSYTAGVLLGGQLVLVVLAVTVTSAGGALQFHALTALTGAAGLALWSAGDAVGVAGRTSRSVGAVVFGLTAAGGTVLLVFMSWNHLAYGDPALAIARLAQVVIPP